MLDVFSITLPIFLIMGLGYLSIQFRLFVKSDISTLGTFVLMIALPALIIRAFSQRTLSQVLDIHYLLAFGLGSLAVMLLGLALMHWGFRRTIDVGAISALGMSSGNSGFIGYPLAVMVVGPTAGVAMALNMVIETAVMIPIALALAEVSLGQQQTFGSVTRGIAVRLIRSPMIVAIVVGMTLSLLEIRLPTPLARTVDMLAMASGPVALFVIGATLHGLHLGGMVSNLSLIVVGKLVLHPLAVLGALWIFPIQDPELRTAAILTAAVPMLSIYPLLGKRFGQEQLCAAALLATTVSSFFTLSLVLTLLKTS